MKFSRRHAVKLIGTAAAAMATLKTIPAKAADTAARWWTPTPAMDAMTAIRSRRSVRSFTPEDVTAEQVQELLGAAMSAPSAGNEQPWQFIIIRDKATLKQVGKINKYASYADNAPVSILVCGDLKKDKFDGYWIEDVSAATQNILLAAHAMGLGAVWTGIYPHEDRVAPFRELIDAPKHIVPMALVVIGHPKRATKPVNRFKEERVHTERWEG